MSTEEVSASNGKVGRPGSGGPPSGVGMHENLFAPSTDDPKYKWKVLVSVS